MRRVFAAHVYGAGPRAHCFWPETAHSPDHPAAEGPISCDVAVIGAGFTGLSAALHLAEAGQDVRVLDAATPGWGASGRNGGFCCLGGSAAPDSMLRRRFGEAARREYRRAEAGAVRLAAALIDRHGIDADTHSRGETLLATTRRAARDFPGRMARIRADYGVTPVLTAAADLAQQGMAGPFHAALTTPLGMALNPLKYALGLAAAAQDAGAGIHGRTPVTGIRRDGRFILTTPAARISARRLIVATNGYSSDDLPDWMRARYLPAQSNVIVTRPLTYAELEAQGWTTRQMCYDDRFFLHYFRLMPDNRMLFGMRGGCSARAGRMRACTAPYGGISTRCSRPGTMSRHRTAGTDCCRLPPILPLTPGRSRTCRGPLPGCRITATGWPWAAMPARCWRTWHWIGPPGCLTPRSCAQRPGAGHWTAGAGPCSGHPMRWRCCAGIERWRRRCGNAGKALAP